jgi:signal transduction histidine kinase
MGDFALASVFDNIIKNALTHGQADKIAITIQRDATHVRIEIADNGRGIPKKVKSRIFTESYVFGKTGNTGIGLDIVRRTVDRYDGTISVHDNFPHGSIFTLVLHAG